MRKQIDLHVVLLLLPMLIVLGAHDKPARIIYLACIALIALGLTFVRAIDMLLFSRRSRSAPDEGLWYHIGSYIITNIVLVGAVGFISWYF